MLRLIKDRTCQESPENSTGVKVPALLSTVINATLTMLYIPLLKHTSFVTCTTHSLFGFPSSPIHRERRRDSMERSHNHIIVIVINYVMIALVLMLLEVTILEEHSLKLEGRSGFLEETNFRLSSKRQHRQMKNNVNYTNLFSGDDTKCMIDVPEKVCPSFFSWPLGPRLESQTSNPRHRILLAIQQVKYYEMIEI